MKKKTVFVTGATGFVGKHLVKKLLEDNIYIFALTRQKQAELLGVPNIQIYIGDITERIQIPEDVSTIYHCAGVISQEEQMQKVNVEGTRRIVEAALTRGCRLIYLSSAGVVGRSNDYLINENTACQPQNMYERSKYEAEKIVLDGINRGLKTQILRPTIIFGTGRAHNQDSFLHLLRSIKHGKYRNIGNGIYNIVHLDEVVRVMRMLDNDNISNGGLYIINSPVHFKDMARIVKAEITGRSAETGSIPYGVAFMAATLLTLISFIIRKPLPLTLSRFRALTNKTIFSQNLLVERLNYQPLLPVEEYIKKTCHDYESAGLL